MPADDVVPDRHIDASDWTEQDLLTNDEAGERLRRELARADTELVQLRRRDDVADHGQMALTEARIESVRASLAAIEAAHGPSV